VEQFLARPAAERQQALEQAGVAHGWPYQSVEKDFWVCLLLRELFALPTHGQHLTFKGGTSLSKAWGLLDRFSEDIDLTLDRDALGYGGEGAPEKAPSRKQLGRRLDALKAECSRTISEAILPGLSERLTRLVPIGEEWALRTDPDDADRQTLLFDYPRLRTPESSTYLRPHVKLEFGARSDPWPVDERLVTSIVAEKFPSLFAEPSCTTRALRPERTFWEKIFLLHEETYRPNDKPRRPRMARHYYDVWWLIESGVASSAANDPTLFDRVAEHRQVYFRQTWVDYSHHRRGEVQALPHQHQLAEWDRDYTAMRAEMFVTEPPPFKVILERIERFQAEWNRG